ncbi:MAG: trigger factor [Lachnospiraceae bacterium]|nr:trigger factor [Lachnospiraceae bacterium]
MKKKLLYVGFMIAMMSSMVACGKEKATGLDAIDPDEYVTLGNYKNLEVTVDHYDFTDDDLKQYIDQDLGYYVSSYDLYEYEVTDRQTVSMNDVVNIDYQGKKDGVAFDGGTAQGAHLEIGSGQFIDGFEDGLVGVNVGETVELNLTFPEEYKYNEELSGQEVVFTVSVNSIDEPKLPEYDEEFFASFGIEGVTNYDEYTNYAKGYIEDACTEQNDSLIDDALWEQVSAKCVIKEVPQILLDEKLAELDADLEEYAAQYGVSTDEMISNMGYDEESYEAQRQSVAKSEAERDLICRAIAKAEGITITDEDVKKTAQDEYEKYGFASAAEMIESKSDEYLRSYVRNKVIMNLIKETATITQNESMPFLDASMY